MLFIISCICSGEGIPGIPCMPAIIHDGSMPGIPGIPIPGMPGMPGIPGIPMPHIGFIPGIPPPAHIIHIIDGSIPGIMPGIPGIPIPGMPIHAIGFMPGMPPIIHAIALGSINALMSPFPLPFIAACAPHVVMFWCACTSIIGTSSPRAFSSSSISSRHCGLHPACGFSPLPLMNGTQSCVLVLTKAMRKLKIVM